MRAIEYSRGTIRIIDQTALPERERTVALRTTRDLADAIRRLRVRGAPALGIAGAMGVAQAAARSKAKTARGVLRDAERAGRLLAGTRPTAVNLAWAIERVLATGRRHAGGHPDELRGVLEEEARRIADEDAAACLAMARHGQRFVHRGATVLTHCNTGMLCTGGYGTAMGVIRLAHESGKRVDVLATETRPLLQGARLTTWELRRLGVPHALIPDAAGAALISRGAVDVVLVGADRIAVNGDVANKIGTYGLALAAREAGVPFVVVAPLSSVDLGVRSGAEIRVERRSDEEVTTVLGRTRIAPAGTKAVNPAFDVTPAKLVTAIVTEAGVARPPFRATLKRLARAGRTTEA